VEYRPNSICLKRKEFVTLPRQIQKGIFRHSATYLDPHLYPSAHTTKLFFDHLDTNSDLELPGFLMVQFTPELIILKPKQGPIGLIEIDVPGAGTYLFPPANLQLVFSASKKNDLHYSSTTAHLDADLANFPFIIRNWIKGDSFQPLGMRGHKKLSDYWIDRKVPRHQRKRIPLVFQGEELIWVAGYTIDDRFKVTEKTINVLKIEMHTKNVEA
jgi:tRNA(Ile)-lysidine synthetase-like protein